MQTLNKKPLRSIALPKLPQKKAYKVADYNSKAWREYSYQLRASTLKCAINGRFYEVHNLVVDHIIPVNEGGSFWDARNHQVINKWSHNKKSASEQANGSKTPYELNELGEKIPKC